MLRPSDVLTFSAVVENINQSSRLFFRTLQTLQENTKEIHANPTDDLAMDMTALE